MRRKSYEEDEIGIWGREISYGIRKASENIFINILDSEGKKLWERERDEIEM